MPGTARSRADTYALATLHPHGVSCCPERPDRSQRKAAMPPHTTAAENDATAHTSARRPSRSMAAALPSHVPPSRKSLDVSDEALLACTAVTAPALANATAP